MDRLFDNKSTLLLDDYPLLILPRLAKCIGLNEAIILQQVHYWTRETARSLSNQRNSHNYQDGWIWVYNSYNQWHKQFPFWSYDTIKRTILSLESKKLLITGNYNKLKADRTKWYRIDYAELKSLDVDEFEDKSAKSNYHQDNFHSPIPETTTETNQNQNQNQNGGSDPEGSHPLNENLPTNHKEHSLTDRKVSREVEFAIAYYFRRYEAEFGYRHPRLKVTQIERVKESLSSVFEDDLETEEWEKLIDQWFTRTVKTDYNINHFSTEGILMNLYFEVLYT